MEINNTSKRFIEAYTYLKKQEKFRNNTDLAKQLSKVKRKVTNDKKAKVDSQAISKYSLGRVDVSKNVLNYFIQAFGLNANYFYKDDPNLFEDEIKPDVIVLDNEAKEPISNYASGKNIRILPISVTEDNNENIVFVPAKAAAGYPERYQEPVFIEKLDHFSLPGNRFKTGTFRCFEVTGDSMLPLILPNSWVIGSYLENWNDIKPDPITGPKIYIVVTTEGVKIKKVLNRIKERGQLVLQSENVTYPTESFLVEDIIEVWELVTEIRFQFKPTEHSLLLRMAYLEEKIHELEKMK